MGAFHVLLIYTNCTKSRKVSHNKYNVRRLHFNLSSCCVLAYVDAYMCLIKLKLFLNGQSSSYLSLICNYVTQLQKNKVKLYQYHSKQYAANHLKPILARKEKMCKKPLSWNGRSFLWSEHDYQWTEKLIQMSSPIPLVSQLVWISH